MRCIGIEKEINVWTKNRSKISPDDLTRYDLVHIIVFVSY
jgi:hypothetical protein